MNLLLKFKLYTVRFFVTQSTVVPLMKDGQLNCKNVFFVSCIFVKNTTGLPTLSHCVVPEFLIIELQKLLHT